MGLSDIMQYVWGPRLYRILRHNDTASHNYAANRVEFYSDSVIKLISLLRSFMVYSSPFVLTYLYKKGYILGDNRFVLHYSLIRIAASVTIALVGAYVIRGIGRMSNNEYAKFIEILSAANSSRISSRAKLAYYEFEFKWWPIDYRWYESDNKKPPQLLDTSRHSRRATMFDKMAKLPCDILSFIVVHTIGRPMLYPGSLTLLHKSLQSALIDGRAALVERYNAERYKLLARDGNHIDSIFIDRRDSNNTNGTTLVICSEGNAGFYEVGTLSTPLSAGYSVLGWNHPGFAGSTGTPFPINDINAIDVVIQFAMERLGFDIEHIMLFAWSIGGYPATWAAMQYPDIKGIVLDASFDDVLPLAESKMPISLRPIVRNTIRSYFNLNNSAHLNLYGGPVLLIRRLRDEIIITNDFESIKTNRGNDLLIKLFNSRFPKLMADENVKSVLVQWLTSDVNTQSNLPVKYRVNEDICLAQLLSYLDANNVHNYPINIGEQLSAPERIAIILFMAQKHMIHYDSTHCTPLPAHYFPQPFDLFAIWRSKTNSNL